MGNTQAAIGLILLLAAIGANLPFINQRLFVVGPRLKRKHLGWQLLEVMCFAALIILLGTQFESRLSIFPAQGWEFYAAMACFFITLAFPGFVWCYLR
jgi:hypothetical protein